MKRFESDKLEIESERLSVFRLILAGLVLLAAYFLSGCAAYTALPVTLQELKHYVIEQEESYPHPLRDVVRAAACSLQKLDFKIERIEVSDQKAYTVAFWGETRVRMEFEAITPTLTRIESRMVKESTWRDYASEKEVFVTVRRALDGEEEVLCRWSRAVRGMVPLYHHPAPGAAVIAYLAPGFSLRVKDKESRPPRWAAIVLEMGGFAYLDQQRYSLKTDLPKKSDLSELSSTDLSLR